MDRGIAMEIGQEAVAVIDGGLTVKKAAANYEILLRDVCAMTDTVVFRVLVVFELELGF